MATVYWEPKAAPVAQVATIEVSAYDAATTYALGVNGVTLVAQAGNASANQTATDLAALWNASTQSYATGITAASDAANITLTADVAEVPFEAAGTVAGGNGTLGNLTITVAPTGPHTLTAADNWSSGNTPADGDEIVFADSDVSALWDLDGLSTGNHTLRIEASYTGSIGLDRGAFERAAAGGNTTTAAPEYRPRYLALDCTRIEVGGHTGAGQPGGSQRLLINNTRTDASQTVVYSTRPTGDTSNESPLRLLFADAGADIDVRAGSCAVATDAPGETSTLGNVTVTDGSFFTGPGVTLAGFVQRNGSSALDLGAATLAAVTQHGGRLLIEGNQAITAVGVWGGQCRCATTGTVTTANARGGDLHFTTAEDHVVTTLNLYRGATVQYDSDVTTIINLLLPEDGRVALTASDARA